MSGFLRWIQSKIKSNSSSTSLHMEYVTRGGEKLFYVRMSIPSYPAGGMIKVNEHPVGLATIHSKDAFDALTNDAGQELPLTSGLEAYYHHDKLEIVLFGVGDLLAPVAPTFYGVTISDI